jgi:hypothetical protein
MYTVYHTDPDDPDSDDDHYFYFEHHNDGINFTDGEEKSYWFFELGPTAWKIDYDGDFGPKGNIDEFHNNLLDSDSDNDGLTDGWEAYYGLKPYDNGTDDLSTIATLDDGIIDNGPDGDPDLDGLKNIQEYNLGTNPIDTDSDGDGLWDGWHDAPPYGQYDLGELKGEVGDIVSGAGGYNTNPAVRDTDRDGLWDGWRDNDGDGYWSAGDEKGELGDPSLSGVGGYGTWPTVTGFDDDGDGKIDEDPIGDPNDRDGDGDTSEPYDDDGDLVPDEDPNGWDSDGDGAGDGYEIYYIKDVDWDNDGYNSQIDPDSDNDGIRDGNDRYYEDSDDDGWCNANDVDSDGEGLLDNEEDLNKDGSFDSGETYPTMPDSDWDCLNDYQEKRIYLTNALLGDSDNDGLRDGSESWEWGSIDIWIDYDGNGEFNNLLDDDADEDGLIDGDEIEYGADMSNPYSDGDTLNDGQEVHTYHTDPIRVDTDCDGLNDDAEITFWADLGKNWNDNEDGDVDEDGCPLINIIDWDSDGDLIGDGADSIPARYNDIDGITIFNYDTIAVNNDIGVSVAIDYTPNSAVKPLITPLIPQTPLNAPISKGFDTSTTAPESFNAIIKVIYSTPLPSGVHEEHIRMYKWDEYACKWNIESRTGVEVDKDYFWSKVTEFSTRDGGDSDEEDSDGDELTDWQELDGHSTDGYYHNGNIYGDSFFFKTNPNDEDTDNDGLNDNLDPIPLNYDMDGDDLLNAPYADMGYTSDQIYTDGGIDINSDDPNMDGDETNDDIDDDDDNDGMDDLYEDIFGVENEGWQNRYLHNERYALLIGGGDTGGENWPCFWKDTRAMYNVLVNQYDFIPEYVYLHFWDHQKGYKDSIYIDGPADFDVTEDYEETFGLGISQTLDKLATRMTKNDLLFVFGIAHGGMDKKKDLGQGWLKVYDVETNHYKCLYYNDPLGGLDNLGQSLDDLSYARMVLVFSCCGSGTAIYGTNDNPEYNLKSENRIILTASDKNEKSYCWHGDPWTSDDDYDHQEFLWNEDQNGFIWELKYTFPRSMQAAFDSGETAAEDDDIVGEDESDAQINEGATYKACYTYL